MKKTFLFLLIGLFLISIISSSNPDLGTFKQNTCVDLIQVCGDCNYNNISRVLFPNSSVALGQVAMDKDDTYYNYTFCNTLTLGDYSVNGYGDPSGTKTSWNYIFHISPSGQSGNSNIVFTIFLIIMVYGITLVGFFGRNEYFSIIGGMAMMFLGVYLILNGIIIYRDNLTLYFSYLTIGLGAFVSIYSALSIVEDNL